MVVARVGAPTAPLRSGHRGAGENQAHGRFRGVLCTEDVALAKRDVCQHQAVSGTL